MLDRLDTRYTVRQLEKDVNFHLKTQGFQLLQGSELTLQGIEAEEGVLLQHSASRVRALALESLGKSTLPSSSDQSNSHNMSSIAIV